MTEEQFLGYLITAVITLGGFVLVIQRLTQPVNDLNVVIQELRDCISSIKSDNAAQNKCIEEQGKEINSLKDRMTQAETRMNMYHPGGH